MMSGWGKNVLFKIITLIFNHLRILSLIKEKMISFSDEPLYYNLVDEEPTTWYKFIEYGELIACSQTPTSIIFVVS